MQTEQYKEDICNCTPPFDCNSNTVSNRGYCGTMDVVPKRLRAKDGHIDVFKLGSQLTGLPRASFARRLLRPEEGTTPPMFDSCSIQSRGRSTPVLRHGADGVADLDALLLFLGLQGVQELANGLCRSQLESYLMVSPSCPSVT